MTGKGRILVVDDDPEICETLKDILEIEGYEVTCANSGQGALDAAGKESFDAALMDIRMQGMDGVETFKRLKTFASFPVIMVSAYAAGEIVRDAMRAGVYAVLQKPIDFRLLASTMESARKGAAAVLVIEDDTDTREVLKDLLADNGYWVVTASDGAAALEIVSRENFDIIILDMKLPVMNGLDAYKRIREIRPHAAVIIVTAYPLEMEGLAKQAVAEGAHSYFRKPFLPNSLLGEMKKIMEMKQ